MDSRKLRMNLFFGGAAPMIREVYYFARHLPGLKKRQRELGPVAFQKDLVRRADAEGFARLRTSLVGDLEGRILELGTGTGATFPYYGRRATVTAVEPYDLFRAAAAEAAAGADAEIEVIPGEGEKLPFEDGTFDAVSASLVLCTVPSPAKPLKEFERVLRPGGRLRLLEHVRSPHWLAGPVMDRFNPVWLRINGTGCNWNRMTVEAVRAAGFEIRSVESYKFYAPSSPATFPLRVIKARNRF